MFKPLVTIAAKDTLVRLHYKNGRLTVLIKEFDLPMESLS
jgi:hypothetical protein